MPNPDLPPFSTEMFDQEPKMAAFMKEMVLPAMAESLGMKLYDPATNQGFGCMGCHPAPQ